MIVGDLMNSPVTELLGDLHGLVIEKIEMRVRISCELGWAGIFAGPLTLSFGRGQPTGTGRGGLLRLTLCNCEWRVVHDKQVILWSGEPPETYQERLQILARRVVSAVRVFMPGPDPHITFEDGAVLQCFAVTSRRYKHWTLHWPDGRHLTIGPELAYTLRDAESVDIARGVITHELLQS